MRILEAVEFSCFGRSVAKTSQLNLREQLFGVCNVRVETRALSSDKIADRG